jgi:Pyruvate/2-oxoacid:ferredoxin oxidoreductase gamma subunit
VAVFSVRIHGRGGQGVVTAAELLAVAAFAEDRYAQAFPSFGSEGTGAPVAAFCRIDDQPIRTREPIAAPDAVVVADPTVMHHDPDRLGDRAEVRRRQRDRTQAGHHLLQGQPRHGVSRTGARQRRAR